MALKDLQVEEPTNTVDLSEKGKLDGETISMDKRLFVQLLVFTGVHDMAPLIEAVEAADVDGVKRRGGAPPAARLDALFSAERRQREMRQTN